jgi:hypothetical protein
VNEEFGPLVGSNHRPRLVKGECNDASWIRDDQSLAADLDAAKEWYSELLGTAGGVVLYWHVDDVGARWRSRCPWAPKEYLPVTERGDSGEHPSDRDPFGHGRVE